MAKLDLMERYKNLSTADPNLYVHGAFLLPSWYVEATIHKQEKMWHDFFAAPKPLISYGDFFHETVTFHPPPEISCSKKIPKLYGGDSEWFAVQPEAAYQFIYKYIQAAKSNRAVGSNIDVIQCMDPSVKFVFDEKIFVYNQDALFWKFDKKYYKGPVGGTLPSIL
ncbi:MAG: hypothetical protein EOO38_07890 [Cytophagaceae bacterium]|nr:MAG: hypothetical protein EOO38_07890 [Cytophagaceae bacterium]